MRRWVCGCAVILTACGRDGGSTPTGPSQQTETRIIRLEANLDFGDMPVGSGSERGLRIYNHGNAPLTVSGFTSPGANTAFSANWTSGTIQPGASQVSVIRFSPPAAQSYSGTFTVTANHSPPLTEIGGTRLLADLTCGPALF